MTAVLYSLDPHPPAARGQLSFGERVVGPAGEFRPGGDRALPLRCLAAERVGVAGRERVVVGEGLVQGVGGAGDIAEVVVSGVGGAGVRVGTGGGAVCAFQSAELKRSVAMFGPFSTGPT